MPKFRKRPVVVEAIQWTGDNIEAVIEMGQRTIWLDATKRLRVQTLEGVVTATQGDWIIKGVMEEVYPCKPNIFEATYEPVEDDSLTLTNEQRLFLLASIDDSGVEYEIGDLVHDQAKDLLAGRSRSDVATMTCPRRMKDSGPWEHKENLDEWTFVKTCTFCGSLHPAEFLWRVEAGEPVVPTDKNYKAYLNDDPWAKFYYQHLSKEQRLRFIELYNNKTMKIGMPGYFYVRPFFIRTDEVQDTTT